jgi:ADP-heptose:LPS heptosyltransferase
MEASDAINNLPALKKIAIFRALYLGDMMCIIPTVRAIRKAYPHAEITLIGLPWQTQFVKRFSKYFNEFIEFPGWPGLPEQEPKEEKIASFLTEVQSKQFDIIFQMQGNGMPTNEMCMRWGGKSIVGLRRTDVEVENAALFPPSDDTDHEVLRFLKLLRPLGIPQDGEELEFPFFESEVEEFKRVRMQLALGESPYVCIHPGARDPKRRWPTENFAYVANRLHEQGLKIVITGSAQEADLMAALEEKLPHGSVNIIKELGDVDLGTLACIIKNGSLLVSNDTGVSHLASALRTPSVIIFSQYSLMERWAPLDPALHQVVSSEKAKDPADVFTIAQDLLQTLKHKTLLFLDQV